MLLVLPTFENLRAKLIQYEVDLHQESQQEDAHPVMMAQAIPRPQFHAPRPRAKSNGT